MSVRNINVKIDERVFRLVRSYAERRGVTVPDLIEGFLTALADPEQRALAARAQILALNTNRPVPIDPPRHPGEDDEGS